MEWLRADWLNTALKVKEERERALITDCNERSGRYGLSLTEEDAAALIVSRNATLKTARRVEFGDGILPKLIDMFCDSQYIQSEEYLETLCALTEVFYQFKNESEDQVTDDELLTFMKEQFEEVCFGSVEYLAETCLERFTRAVRAGFKGHEKSGGRGVYENFQEEMRWDPALYLTALFEKLS